MALRDQIDDIIKYIESKREDRQLAHKVFNILEGDILTYIHESLKQQILSPKALAAAEKRIPPLNLYLRIVNKLSKIYSKPVLRKAANKNTTDQELVDLYVDLFKLDSTFSNLNKFYNASKYGSVEPYIKEDPTGIEFAKQKLRVLAPHNFLMYSDDRQDPSNPTICIKFMGKIDDVEVIFLYSATEFLAISEKGEILPQFLEENEGVNVYGVLTNPYVNKSDNLVMPKPDSDMFNMSILIPILLTDLAFAIEFMAHSIIWGKNVKAENLELNPNAFWDLHATDTEKDAEVGQIKPEVDILEVLEFIVNLVALWLETKNVKPGSAGKVTQDNVVSGVAMVVQNADTTEDRNEQIVKFGEFESEDFWPTLAIMHNYWAENGLIEERRRFSEDFEVSVVYPDPKPLQSRLETVKEQKEMLDASLTTIEMALKEVHPQLDDDEIIVLQEKINEAKELVIKAFENGGETTEDYDQDRQAV